MISAPQTSTELAPSVVETLDKLIKDTEKLEQVSSSEPSGTSSELQPFTIPKIDLACNSYLKIITSKVYTSEVHLLSNEQYEQLLHKFISNYKASYKELLGSIRRILRQGIRGETLSPLLTLDLWTLEQPYILRGHSEVPEFLADNSFLLPVLQDAHKQIKNYFGKSTQIVLEVVTDPEVAEDQELLIFIRTSLSPDKAFKKLKEFDKGWWLDTPFNVREKLCIDVEFE